MPTRALLLSAYIKFVNLFPEVKPTIQDVLRSDGQLKNADVELQQRAVEYLRLSSVASTDILVGAPPAASRSRARIHGLRAVLTRLLPHQATVLEEMPPFPERESSILAKLKKKKGPSTVTGLEEGKRERGADVNGGPEPAPASATVGSLLTPVPRTSPCVSHPRDWEPAERVRAGETFLSHTENVCQEPGGGTEPGAFTCPSPGTPRNSSHADTPAPFPDSPTVVLGLSRAPRSCLSASMGNGAPASFAGRRVQEACLKQPTSGPPPAALGGFPPESAQPPSLCVVEWEHSGKRKYVCRRSPGPSVALRLVPFLSPHN